MNSNHTTVLISILYVKRVVFCPALRVFVLFSMPVLVRHTFLKALLNFNLYTN